MTTHIDTLYAEPCKCVSCADCRGSGKVWMEHFGIEEPERCDTCDGSGLVEVCQRCMDIDEIERDEDRECEIELERERLRLAACGTAAIGYFVDCKDEYRSASLEDVLALRRKYELSLAAGLTHEAEVKELIQAAEAMIAHYSGSLDHQPPYVRLMRAALAKVKP